MPDPKPRSLPFDWLEPRRNPALAATERERRVTMYRVELEERGDHAADCSAGAGDENAAPRDREAEVLRQIADQARPVGVVTENPAVLEAQRVDGARAPRSLR